MCSKTETEQTMNQANAAKYVREVGAVEAKASTHYATGTICHCGTCFCCEVKKLVKQVEEGEVTL